LACVDSVGTSLTLEILRAPIAGPSLVVRDPTVGCIHPVGQRAQGVHQELVKQQAVAVEGVDDGDVSLEEVPIIGVNIPTPMGDVRLLPLVMPTKKQHKALDELARQAVTVQTDILQNGRPRQAELRTIQDEVNATVEELYGVRGLGPFNEF
jgi:hypothetical protein